MTFSSERHQCPACDCKRGVAIDTETGVGHCHRCSKSFPPGPEFDFSPKETSLADLIPQDQITYGDLDSRGISIITCRKYRYGVATYNGKRCQVAQFTDAAGVVRAQKLRLPDKKFIWLNGEGADEVKGLFGRTLFHDGGRTKANGLKSRLTITEGELDALACAEALGNWPVVSLPDGAASAERWLKKDLEFVESFEEIVLAFDGDEAGQEATQKALALISPGKAKIVRWPADCKDACDVMKEKGGPELRKILWDAAAYAPEWVVDGDDILEEIFDGGLEPGFSWPWSGLDHAFEGIRPKQMTLIAAGTSSGKSLFCRHLALHCAEQGRRVGYIALEESPRQSALGVYGIALQRHLQLERELPEDEIREVHERIGDKLVFTKHWGSVSEDDSLVKKIRYCIKGLSCPVIFLDHVSMAVSGMDASADERRTLDKLMTDLRSLVEDTGVHLFIVSHLRRAKDGSHEEGKSVSTADLRGSHSLGQIPDNIVGLERNQQADDMDSRNTTKVRVLKNRDCGRLGVIEHLKFDPQNHCLQAVPIEETPTASYEDFS
jgi:twinkle protein